MATTKATNGKANGRLTKDLAELLPTEGAAPASKLAKGAAKVISIPKLNIIQLSVPVRGITPLLICKFDQKVQQEMQDRTEGKAKNRKAPKDPEAEWNAARHIAARSRDGRAGWDGIHAGGIRAAMIDAARVVDGVTMTELKQMLFVKADGWSAEGAPLVKIEGAARKHTAMCRTTTGVAYPRHRPMYDEWSATIRLQVVGISEEEAVNLLSIAGFTCGVGEWRPTSPKSKTGDCGRFEVIGAEVAAD